MKKTRLQNESMQFVAKLSLDKQLTIDDIIFMLMEANVQLVRLRDPKVMKYDKKLGAIIDGLNKIGSFYE